MAQRRTRTYWEDGANAADSSLGRHAAGRSRPYQAQVRPVYGEEIPVYPKVTPVQPKPLVQPHPQSSAKNLRKAKVQLSIGKTILAGLVSILFFAMIGMTLNQLLELGSLQGSVEETKRRIAGMQEDSARLEDDIKYTMDGEKIRNYAVNNMGMRPPSDEQTRYITLDGTISASIP